MVVLMNNFAPFFAGRLLAVFEGSFMSKWFMCRSCANVFIFFVATEKFFELEEILIEQAAAGFLIAHPGCQDLSAVVGWILELNRDSYLFSLDNRFPKTCDDFEGWDFAKFFDVLEIKLSYFDRLKDDENVKLLVQARDKISVLCCGVMLRAEENKKAAQHKLEEEEKRKERDTF